MIEEARIDEVIQQLDAGTMKDSFEDLQEDFLSYLIDDILPNLNSEEQEMLLFISSVIHHCRPEPASIDIESFHEHEESNWQIRNELDKWEDTKDAYFKDYKEEDLLAFAEDMLQTEDEMSAIGKELIFITTKSFIDCVTEITK